MELFKMDIIEVVLVFYMIEDIFLFNELLF